MKYTSEERDSNGSDRGRSKSKAKTNDLPNETGGTKEKSPDTDILVCGGSREDTPEVTVIKEHHNPIIEGIVQPKVNKMTEDLRAKVRAMLESKK